MAAKVWYVAAGKKKAGPMTSGRLRKQVGLGKVPDGALAWREGMDEWEPVEAIDRFQVSDGSETELVDSPDDSRGSSEERATRKKKKTRSSKAKVAVLDAPAKKARRTVTKSRQRKVESDAAAALSFVPLYRIGWTDMWRAFGMGLEGGRVKLALAASLLPFVGAGLLVALAALAAQASVLLALPLLGLAGLAGYVLLTVAMGALSYYSRHQLQELERPTVKESLRYALDRAAAMSLPPFLLSIAWLVPVIALAILAVMVKIPFLGPLGTGLLFGVHVALSASVLFLIMGAGVAGVFGPVTAAFEETGAKSTMRLVLEFARRSMARTALWGLLPTAAMGPFTGALLALGVVVLAIPLAAVAAAVGPDTLMWIQGGGMGEPPHAMLTPMVLMIAAWVGLVFTALGAIVTSVQNALCSLLYLGGRQGNDAQISRDTYLARRAGGEA
jgi:hypothetical protein